jgi:hypothetical protein
MVFLNKPASTGCPSIRAMEVIADAVQSAGVDQVEVAQFRVVVERPGRADSHPPRTATPSEAILSGPTKTPRAPSTRRAMMPKLGQRIQDNLFQPIDHVPYRRPVSWGGGRIRDRPRAVRAVVGDQPPPLHLKKGNALTRQMVGESTRMSESWARRPLVARVVFEHDQNLGPFA